MLRLNDFLNGKGCRYRQGLSCTIWMHFPLSRVGTARIMPYIDLSVISPYADRAGEKMVGRKVEWEDGLGKGQFWKGQTARDWRHQLLITATGPQ